MPDTRHCNPCLEQLHLCFPHPSERVQVEHKRAAKRHADQMNKRYEPMDHKGFEELTQGEDEQIDRQTGGRCINSGILN